MQKWLGQKEWQRELEETSGAAFIITKESGGESAVIEAVLQEMAAGLPPSGSESWYCVPDWEREGSYTKLCLPRAEGAAWQRDIQKLVFDLDSHFLAQCEEKETDWEAWQETLLARLLEPLNAYWSAPELVAYQTGLAERWSGVLLGEEGELVEWLPEPMTEAVERPVLWASGPLPRTRLTGHPEYRAARRWTPGLLQEASGGYLLLEAEPIFRQPELWSSLRDAMLRAELPGPAGFPLRTQIFLYGSAALYRVWKAMDADFERLFQHSVLLPAYQPDTEANRGEWQAYLEAWSREAGLCMEKEAVGEVLAWLQRKEECGGQLPCCFYSSEEILQQAALLCREDGLDSLDADVLRRARKRQREKERQRADRFFEEAAGQLQSIRLDGAEIGSVNGLVVCDLGYQRLGQPIRITARYQNRQPEIRSAEERAEMAGRIFRKGLEFLQSYLGGMRRQRSRRVILCCEQNYSRIEGDSALLAQTCGVLSLLSGCPIRQSVAVTGSMNADGELLPVGGITEKIEGFYDFCCGRSPKEIPGVLFPADNQKELYLAEDVRRAVERGEFRLYPVRTLEEALTILTGRPACRLLSRVRRHL